jgi:signal transduction histidine kinase/ActR/RegA family two-component response regulator
MNAPTAPVHAALARWFSELTHEGLFATDAELRVIVWNRWMEIHTRRQAADVAGRPLFQLYPDLVSRGLDARYHDALRDGRISTLSYGLHGYVIPVVPTNADLGLMEMPQSGRIAPLRDGDTVIGTVTVVENVSERLASDAELRRQIEAQKVARSTAERALRDKDEFLSTLSHELRTPLNAVLGWSRILMTRQDTDPAMLARALNVIERNAAVQAAMIDDILDVARIVSGKLRLEMTPVELAPIVLAAVDVIAPSAAAKHVTVHPTLDADAPQVLGDAGRLQQIVGNLLSNAVKFTDSGGVIDVTLSTLDDAVQLVVSDSGRGISPSFLPFVFERFRQGDTSSSRRQGGLGLGLALARDLVELHGGTIRAESGGERRGAAFTIRLPILARSDPASSDALHRVEEVDGSLSLAGVTALVVEDECDSRDLLTALLGRYGAQVLAVSSCDEAIVRLKSHDERRIDVVVSDIGMPRHDGYELMQRMRGLPAEVARVPALAVTGYATQQDRLRVLAAGYRAHLAKPVNPSELVAAVKRVLREPTRS